jgi:O-antigen/teichoic acid export membrane protein
VIDRKGDHQPEVESADRLAHRVFTSTIWNNLGYGATLLTWFLLTPFVVASLGTEEYGLFAVAVAVMGYGQLFELGMSNAVTRFVAELHERGDARGLRDLVVTAFAVSVGLAALVTLAGIAFAPYASDVFGVAPDMVDTTETLMVVAGITAGVAFPTATLFALLTGLQRFDLHNVLQVTATLLLAGFTIAALVAGLGVVWVIGAGIPTSLLVQIPALIAIRRVAPDLRLLAGRPRWSDVRRLISFSWAVLFMQGAGLIKGRTDEIVIAAVLPVAKVTPYALARRASEAPGLMTYQFTRVIMPLAAQMGARNEHERLRAVFVTGTRLTIAAYLAVGTATAVLAGPFLAAWVGEEFRSAGTILAVLAVAGAVSMASLTADSVMQGIFRHRPLALFAVLGAFLNLGLSIALIHPFGTVGVAVATLVAAVVEVVLLTIPYVMRTLGIRGRALLSEVLLPVIIPLIPAAAIAVGLLLVVHAAPLGVVLLAGAVIVVTYVTTYLAIGATELERALARRVLGVATRRLRPAR